MMSARNQSAEGLANSIMEQTYPELQDFSSATPSAPHGPHPNQFKSIVLLLGIVFQDSHFFQQPFPFPELFYVIGESFDLTF